MVKSEGPASDVRTVTSSHPEEDYYEDDEDPRPSCFGTSQKRTHMQRRGKGMEGDAGGVFN
jgi:hypothetical protein